jgi:hypothetical protein
MLTEWWCELEQLASSQPSSASTTLRHYFAEPLPSRVSTVAVTEMRWAHVATELVARARETNRGKPTLSVKC